MKTLRLIAVAVVWLISLVGVAVWAQGRGGTTLAGAPSGPIISGPNVGFQRMNELEPNGRIWGRLMVRVDGFWLAASEPIALETGMNR